MSKIGTLTAFLKGMHVMGDNGLRDYHAAKLAVNAGRKRGIEAQCAAVKIALNNHRVTVCIWAGDVCVRRTTDADGSTLTCPKSWYLHS